jgi:hypothetical protein
VLDLFHGQSRRVFIGNGLEAMGTSWDISEK